MSKICDDLRASILQAAMQGKLTDQLPTDDNVDDLLASINAERQKLIREGKLKKQKPLPPITDNDEPFDIPNTWRWVRLGNYAETVTDYVASGSFASLRENVPSFKQPDYAIMVKTADFRNGFKKNLTYTTKHGYEFLHNSNLFGGELILSNIGSIGSVFIVPRLNQKMTLAPNSVMIRLSFDYLRDYLYNFVLSPIGKSELVKITSGTAMKKFNKTDLRTILLPIPPLAEQKRIVAKIDELMDRVNRLEKTTDALASIKSAFPSDLKSALLQAAMQGKLTDQLPTDDNVDDLLANIKLERQKLIREGKLKKQKPLPPITDNDKPFDIPDTWRWVRLGEIAGFDIRRGKSPKYNLSNINFAFAQKCNSKYDGIRFDLAKSVDNSCADKWGNEGKLRAGDIVLNSTGGGTLGRAGYIDTIPNGVNYYPDSHVTLIRTLVDQRFIYYFCKMSQKDFENCGEGSTNQIELKASFINQYHIPLPSLAEQKRIVAKLEQLLPICDKVASLSN